MEKKDIIIIAAILAAAGFNLYRKYIVKKDKGTGKTNELLSSRKTDDYEPYSGK